MYISDVYSLFYLKCVWRRGHVYYYKDILTNSGNMVESGVKPHKPLQIQWLT